MREGAALRVRSAGPHRWQEFIALDEDDTNTTWHLMAYEEFFPDVESAERALAEPGFAIPAFAAAVLVLLVIAAYTPAEASRGHVT